MSSRPLTPAADTDALAAKWAALHEAAGVVAALAGAGAVACDSRFPARADAAGGWRLALAGQGIDDLAAVMRPGIAALVAASAGGAKPTAAAAVLWGEFVRARDAVLQLLPQS
jgi:hypothetical protein